MCPDSVFKQSEGATLLNEIIGIYPLFFPTPAGLTYRHPIRAAACLLMTKFSCSLGAILRLSPGRTACHLTGSRIDSSESKKRRLPIIIAVFAVLVLISSSGLMMMTTSPRKTTSSQIVQKILQCISQLVMHLTLNFMVGKSPHLRSLLS